MNSITSAVPAQRPVALRLVPAPRTEQPPGTRRSYALEVDDAPETLERVLAQLRRRRCRVTDVAFAAPYEDGAPANLVLGIQTRSEQAHLVEAWLGDMVAVRSVALLAA